eukprot:6668847-Prymnesium_polylepis.1
MGSGMEANADRMYVSPRDRTQIMRLQRRNLWVAEHGGCDHTTCAATGCNAPESQLHLVECPILRARFWTLDAFGRTHDKYRTRSGGHAHFLDNRGTTNGETNRQ